MNRFTAFAILRLKPDASLEEVKAARFTLLKEAQDNSDGNAMDQIQEAFATILRTQDENIGQPVHFIAGAVFTGDTSITTYKHTVPPYEEAVIKSRIDALPDRVSCRCCSTGEKFSVQLKFKKYLNSFTLGNPLPYRGEPSLDTVTFPVEQDDLEEDTILSSIDTGREDNQEYYSKFVSEDVFLDVHKAVTLTSCVQFYSRKTSLNNIRAQNDIDFGHRHACHICGSDHYAICKECGHVSCRPPKDYWPSSWDDNLYQGKLDCPECGQATIFHRNPSIPISIPEVSDEDRKRLFNRKVTRRIQSGAIGHDAVKSIERLEPLRRIGSK